MKKHELTIPQLGLIAGTRAMLGAGIALLLSEKLIREQRRAIGWTLVAVDPAQTEGLGWPMNRTSPRWYRLRRV